MSASPRSTGPTSPAPSREGYKLEESRKWASTLVGPDPAPRRAGATRLDLRHL